MDKYDQAIEYLKNVDPGSYFDECAELMEELLFQLHEKKPKRYKMTDEEHARLKQMEAGARYYFKCRSVLK